MLKIHNLEVCYDKHITVQNVNLSVQAGEIVGIVGESGSGKSTLVRSVVDILPKGGCVTNGCIHFCGKELTTLKDKQMNAVRGKDIAMIFQHPQLTMEPLMTIDQAFYECIHVHRKCERREAREIGKSLMTDLGLEKPDRILNSYPFELSGGMAQRVAVALALVNGPKLVLADEPTSALDVTVQRKMIDLLLRVRDNTGRALLLGSHNLCLIAKIADRVGGMYLGKLLEWGLKEEGLYRPQHGYTDRLIRAIPKIQW